VKRRYLIPASTKTITRLLRENRRLQANLDAERMCSASLRAALDHQRRAALTDPLTGLYNRRAMDQRLGTLWADSDEGPFALLVLDIDYLKRINDTHGHISGDTAIRRVAEILRRCIRAGDCAFRFGGEEFMVLLPDTTPEGAISLAESIRGRIEAHNRTLPREWQVPLTVSLGVASRKDGDNPISLFERADRALYQAKHSGRNRVVSEDSLV
jgi:diguanylate cyclase